MSLEGARLDVMVETSQRTKVSWEGSQAANAPDSRISSSTRKNSFRKSAASGRLTPTKGEHTTKTNVSELSETHQSCVATLVQQFPAFTRGPLPPPHRSCWAMIWRPRAPGRCRCPSHTLPPQKTAASPRPPRISGMSGAPGYSVYSRRPGISGPHRNIRGVCHRRSVRHVTCPLLLRLQRCDQTLGIKPGEVMGFLKMQHFNLAKTRAQIKSTVVNPPPPKSWSPW